MCKLTGGRAMLDVRAEVANALYWNLAVPRYRVRAEVDGGVVTLHGSVERAYEKSSAEATVRLVPGVMGVKNEIAISVAQGASLSTSRCWLTTAERLPERVVPTVRAWAKASRRRRTLWKLFGLFLTVVYFNTSYAQGLTHVGKDPIVSEPSTWRWQVTTILGNQHRLHSETVGPSQT